MTPLSNDKLLGQVAQGLAGDGRSLDALKREAQRDPHSAVNRAAQQFEALFMQMVLKSMRDALPKSGMLDSTAQQMYTGMLDQQLATKVAASGTGLADMIAKQLTRHMRAGVGSAEKQSGVGSAEKQSGVGSAEKQSGVGSAESGANSTPVSHAALRRHNSAIAAYSLAPANETARPTPDSRLPTPDSIERRFVLRHWDHALAAERHTGIPAKFIVGQAALESGWGRHEMRDATGRPSHNLFGIKAGANWRGRTVEVLTTEYENGVEKKVVERFRAYDNYGEAFRDWAQLMASNPRYAAVLRAGRDAHAFAHGLQRAGYATDPQYGAKLARVIDTAAALRGDA